MASSSGNGSAKSWVAALKDQAGLCRRNYAFRSMQQRPRTAAGNGPYKNRTVPQSGGVAAARREAKQSEEALRTIMYLSCWGPNN